MRIYFNIGNQPDNLGDVILNRNLVAIYAKRGEVIFDDHYVNDHYIREMGGDPANAISRRPDLPNLRTVGGRFRMLLSSKQYYQVFSRPPGHMFRRKRLRTYYHAVIYTLFLLALRARGIRIVLVGVTMSTDHLTGPLLWLERLQAKLHQLHSVRDSSIHQRLLELGIKQNKLVPDLFLLATPDAPPAPKEEVETRSHPRIVLNLRHDIPEADDVEAYKALVKRRALELVKKLPPQAEIVLAYQVDRDKHFMGEIYKAIAEDPRVSLRSECETVDSARELYADATAVLSNRLHCLLYAVTLGTPAIPFSDFAIHQKVRGAFKDFELAHWFYDINTDISDALEKLRQIESDEWLKRTEVFEVARGLKHKVSAAIEEALCW